ncbi:MAG: thioredoxin [Helicobacteraceae bacterium]|jgi:thioredoxin 1|nr:thioredoxin [Helicobacteraceae bacterium]
MSAAIELNGQNFKENTQSGVCMVDFWAPWCGPCRMVAPTIDAVAEQFAGKVKVFKVNVDENGDLATEYGVRSIPTIVLLKDGAQVDSIIGVQTRAAFEEKLNKLL